VSGCGWDGGLGYFVEFLRFLVEIGEEVGVVFGLFFAEFGEVFFWFCHGE
jgi:hypothetical protein